YLVGEFAVAGCSRGQEQQGIFFADRVGLLHFVKQLRRVIKLRFEMVAYFRANVVTALVNPWADDSLNVERPSAKITPQFSHALFYNALHRAPPPGMKDTHRAPFRVHKNDRQ